MDRGFLGRLLGGAALAAAFFAANVDASRAASCGGLLQPRCAPAPLYPPAPDPGGDAEAAMTVPPAAPKQFGFNTNLWWQTHNGQNLVPFEVYRSAKAGANLIRTTVTWSRFATSPDRPLADDGYYYPQRGTVPNAGSLKQLDELYDRATAAGLQLDLVINDAPVWASAYSDCRSILGVYTGRCAVLGTGARLYPTSDHVGDLARFVIALGQRYPGVVFETWNEPNLDRGAQAASGAFLGTMQCSVWQAARTLPQPSLVLSPAFGDFYGEDATRSYMRDFYSTGRGCFDRLSVHTYNGSNQSFGANSPLAGHMKIYRDARAEAGDSAPIWVTEFGFKTGSTDGSVSEQKQALLTGQEYNKLLTMPDVEAAIVNTLRDAPRPGATSPRDPDYAYGWLRKDGSMKPVYCQFSALAGTPAC
jgi:hypothetical protein